MSVANFLNPLVAALAGLGGVWLGGWLGDRREREKRRSDIVTRQLAEFYGPLVSMRAEILARSQLRVKISGAANGAWQDLIAEARRINIEESARASKERMPAFSALNADDNTTFRETLMPMYGQMLALFREKMWLAEPETRGYFASFVEFVEIWERWLREAIPREVIGQLDHTEENLHPFYAHLVEVHDRLRHSLTES